MDGPKYHIPFSSIQASIYQQKNSLYKSTVTTFGDNIWTFIVRNILQNLITKCLPGAVGTIVSGGDLAKVQRAVCAFKKPKLAINAKIGHFISK